MLRTMERARGTSRGSTPSRAAADGEPERRLMERLMEDSNDANRQELTLVPISAQHELLCPTYDPP